MTGALGAAKVLAPASSFAWNRGWYNNVHEAFGRLVRTQRSSSSANEVGAQTSYDQAGNRVIVLPLNGYTFIRLGT